MLTPLKPRVPSIVTHYCQIIVMLWNKVFLSFFLFDWTLETILSSLLSKSILACLREPLKELDVLLDTQVLSAVAR